MSTLVLSITILLNTGVMKDDFLVNSDSPNKCTKGNALAAPSPSGWFVAWEDTRNARNDESDLFGQFLSTDLTKSGSNRMVTSDSMHREISLVSVFSDSSGKTYIFWRAGGDAGEYWLRKVSASGQLLGKDTMLFALGPYHEAAMAMNENGEYVILWQDAGYMGLLKFNADGTQNGKVQHVLEGSGLNLKVSIASNGAVIAVWSTEIADTLMVCARTYRPNGEPRGDWFMVFGYTEWAHVPWIASLDVGSDHSGKFVITWILRDALITTPYVLYFRAYPWDGTTSEPAKAILKMKSNLTSISPHKMAVSWDGSFSVAWSDQRSGHYRSYLQNFFADGSLRGQEMTISEEGPEDCFLKALVLQADQWFAVYSRTRGGLTELYGRRGMVYGSIIGDEMLITDDESSIFETGPQVLADDNGNFIALWGEDWRYGASCLRRFSNEDEFLSDVLSLKDSSDINRLLPQYYARTSMNRKNGEFVFVYKATGDPSKIRAQRYSSGGYPDKNEVAFKLNEYSYGYFNVSMNRKGSFAVAWVQKIEGSSVICVKRFDKDNLAIDDSEIVMGKPSISSYFYNPPAIGLKDDGGFVVVWKDLRGGIWMQRFRSTAEPLGEENMVNDEGPSDNCLKPALAIDEKGNFCIAWTDSVYTFVQFFDALGSKLGSNINTGIQAGTYTSVSNASLPGGGFVVYATDYSNSEDNPEVSAVYYHSDGTAWSRKLQVNDPDQFCFHYQVANYNSVATGGNRIIYVWQDNRRHKGWDIYAKIYDLDITGISEPSPSPSSPVTPVTHQIDLESGIGSTITLRYSDFPEGLRASVYDASGRRVDQLYTSQKQGTIQWGQDRAPGVYFIVPEALTRRPLKVVLVR
ncbi:hypothetical protein GX441_01780 [bacterium]|nr:hypothetical protein [bacterium]